MLESFRHAVSGPPRSAPFWRALLLLLLAAVAWLALTPAPPPQANLGWDKLNHAAAFAALAAVARAGCASAGWRLACALLAYGALIEVLQAFTPTRSAEWADLLADGVGIAIGLSLATAWLRRAARSGSS